VTSSFPIHLCSMKNLIISAIVFSLVSIGCTEKQQDTSINQISNKKMETKDKEQIKETIKIYFNALNNSNAQTAVEQYTNDGVFMPKEAPTSVGKEQLKEAYKHVFNTLGFINMGYTIDELSIEADVAIVRTSSLGNMKILANDVVIEGATHRELFVMKKENSQWKIARYMFNNIK